MLKLYLCLATMSIYY